MANTINLNAEVGANFIGDDAQPSLTITNSSTGAGLQVDKFVVTSSATITAPEMVGAGRYVGNTSTTVPVTLVKTTLSTPTSALMAAVVSTASTPVIQLAAQAFVSAVSLIFAAGSGWAGMGAIPVQRSDGTLGWIPVLPPTQVTGAVFS